MNPKKEPKHMTLEQRLKKKAMDFCEKRSVPANQEVIHYLGLREEELPPSYEPKEYHKITLYLGEEDGPGQHFFLFVDPTTEKSVFFIGPHYSEELDE